MGNIVRAGANALAVPDTLASYELGAPIPKAVEDFVVKNFVLPVLLKYDGGHGIPDEHKPMLLAEYAEDCAGFMPDAYRLAIKMMGRDRNGRWRPDPAECREWLQRAEDDICARTGRPQQVRDQDELRSAMLGALCGVSTEKVRSEETGGMFAGKRERIEYIELPRVWDRDRLGPMPTERGCRLDAAVQRECWLRRFAWSEMDHDLALSRHIEGYEAKPPLSREAHLRKTAKGLEALGIKIAPPACPILRGAMADRKVPTTAEEIAAADAEIADYAACVAAKKAEDSERARLRQEQKAREHKEWEAAAQAEAERKRRKQLEMLADSAASLLPEIEEAFAAFKETGGGAAALEAYQAHFGRARSRELDRLLSEPAYVDECTQKIAIRKSADAALAKAAWRAETEARLADQTGANG